MVTRYRVISDPATTVSTYTHHPLTGANTTYNISRPPARHKMMFDETIEKFMERRSKGEIFNNTLSSTEILFDCIGGYDGGTNILTGSNAGKFTRYTYTEGGMLLEMYNNGTLVFPEVPLDVTGGAAIASQDCLGNVNGSEADLINFLGELDKTRNLYRSILDSIFDMFVKGARYRRPRDRIEKIPLYDKHGNVMLNRKGKPIYRYIHNQTGGESGAQLEKVNGLAGTYLAIRMGLLPLVNDLKGALKALLSSKAIRQTARGRKGLSDTVTITKTVADGPGDFTVTLTTSRAITIRYGILYESAVIVRLAAQFGLTRPFSSIWELTPWSFVFDWFFRVGAWLDAVQPSGASKIICAWASTHEVIIQTATVNQTLSKTTPNGVSVTAATWNESLTKVTVLKNRAPWEITLPTRPLPGKGVSGLRCIDTLALFAQKLGAFFKNR